MKPRKIQTAAIIAVCCVGAYSTALAQGRSGGGGGGGGMGGAGVGGGASISSHGLNSGNSAFGRAQAGGPITGSANSAFGRGTAADAKLRADQETSVTTETKKRKDKKAKAAARARVEASTGNSAFGQKQGDATTRTTGSQNSSFGQDRSATAKAGRTTATSDRTEVSTTPRGNSAFGHKQGDPATRTKGKGNSQYGRDRAAAAKPSPTPAPTP